MKLILASGSKTRYDLLKSLHISFQVEPVEPIEIINTMSNEDYCQEISRIKAKQIAKNHSDGIIIAAESKVFFQGKAYGKPKSEKEAKKMIVKAKFNSVIQGIKEETVQNLILEEVDRRLD